MTDRVHVLTVALKEPMRTDDVEALVNAIRLLHNVASVTTEIVTPDAYWAAERARQDLASQIWAVLHPTMRP